MDDAVELLETEPFVFAEEDVIWAEVFLWHAVGAAQITPICKGDAEISEGALELIEQGSLCGLGADPLGGAVGEGFVFPDGETFLDGVHDPGGGEKGGLAVL